MDSRVTADNPLGLRPQYLHASETYWRRVHASFLIAPDLDTCTALLRGEHVPAERLDPRYLHLLGQASRTTDG